MCNVHTMTGANGLLHRRPPVGTDPLQGKSDNSCTCGSPCSISHCVDMPPHTSKHMSLASSLYHCTYTQDAYAAAGQLEAMRDAVKWPLDYFMWVGNQPRLRVSYCKCSRLLID